ncbi:transcriptional regulator, LacI family [bacterium A37T11]|nr:transcriptional regulator, LacI family [bacterium A37T11]
MGKKILISDIAKALNVSITTVSFILNGKAKEKRISDGLTKKVLEYINEVGYKPNELAKSLRTGKTKIIGLMVEDISNPFFANIARYIEEKAYKRGYRIIYCSTENDTAKTSELIRMFRDRHVDGYIITPSEGIDKDIENLLTDQLPLVLFDRNLPHLQTNYVVSDNFRGAYEATLHLAEQGFKKIGFVTLNSDQSQMGDRLSGYLKAIEVFQLTPYIKKITTSIEEQNKIDSLTEFFIIEKPDAVFFATNYLAISGLRALKDAETPLPALVSFDDHVLFRLYNPTITVVSQPIEQIASELINILLKQLDNPKGKAILQQIILPSMLIVRESSIKKKGK